MTRLLILDALLLTAIWYVLLPAPALAYFDFGTGTYMVQLIFGFGAAIWLSVKNSVFRKPKINKNIAATPPAPEASVQQSDSRPQ